MSTVLWANALIDGMVQSDETDKHALYTYSRQLDKLTRKLGVASFAKCQDMTDAEFNMSSRNLPNGMDSTTQLMAIQGKWLPASEGVRMLEALIGHIEQHRPRFGLVRNNRSTVVHELNHALKVARKAEVANGKFNFSVVL